ncbi:MAG: metal-dependent hydrolase [Myxococcales bacterium]
MSEPVSLHPIRPRKFKVPFDDVPRHWFAGMPLPTHLANGVNLLFPAGERFFVRSVHRYLDRVTDPALLEQVKGFSGQEGRHAAAHDRFFEALERQGFEIRRFLRFYEWFAYRVVEPIAPASLRLATTAACEHFTAILAHDALTNGMLEQHADPALRDLLMWHAAEEIEHKAVAFDVLKLVNPSYLLRMAGLYVATVMLGGFWMLGTAMLLKQDPEATLKRILEDRRKLKGRTPLLRVFVGGILRYVRPSFHPNQENDLGVARDYLQRAGDSIEPVGVASQSPA